MNTKMKNIRIMSFLAAGLLVVMMAGCGPGLCKHRGWIRPRLLCSTPPYYGYNYGPDPMGITDRRSWFAPPVVVRPRYYAPAPRVYGGSIGRGSYGGGSPNARGG